MTRLEQLRLDKGLTALQLADRAGVAHKTIYNIEAGKGANVATLVKLADALEARPSELLMPAIPPSEKAAA